MVGRLPKWSLTTQPLRAPEFATIHHLSAPTTMVGRGTFHRPRPISRNSFQSLLLRKIANDFSKRRVFRLSRGMDQSLKHRRELTEDESNAIVLAVGIPPAGLEALGSERFSLTQSGRDALAALKLMRFRWLLASMDVPDMRPWILFERARQAQSRLRCALIDNRLTTEDEQRVRQTGAAIFSPGDRSLWTAIGPSAARLQPRLAEPASAPP